jgi:hypothetical protein
MIADLLEAWATRLETLALPPGVIAAEARALSVLARQEHDKTKDDTAELLAEARAESGPRTEKKGR